MQAEPINQSDTSEGVAPELQITRMFLEHVDNILVLTGAGISAESGVPTFRGEGERWRNKHYGELANPDAFQKDPREIWDWYLYRRGVVANCRPNPAHQALASWSSRQKGVTLVTQNVDGLHERAGSENVIRFHGSLWRNRCTACGTEREDMSLVYDELPHSPCCNALERPAIVWFGEVIPDNALNQSMSALLQAKIVLVIGTSGAVQPAAGLVGFAKRRKAVVIDVNPEESLIESDIYIPMNAGEAIPALVG